MITVVDAVPLGSLMVRTLFRAGSGAVSGVRSRGRRLLFLDEVGGNEQVPDLEVPARCVRPAGAAGDDTSSAEAARAAGFSAGAVVVAAVGTPLWTAAGTSVCSGVTSANRLVSILDATNSPPIV